jgi:hypothetical protein
MSALAKGNHVRITRAKLKRELKADRSLNECIRILRDPPEVLHTMKIETFLMSLPGFARSKANNMLRRAGTAPSKSLAGLSERQRLTLVRLLLELQVRRLAL